MLTKQQKDKKDSRITKQVRVGIGNHAELKLLAIKSGVTISKMIDRILEGYFKSTKCDKVLRNGD